MIRSLPLLLALAAALAAPPTDTVYDDYPMAVPQKRAALVLDRLLVALQKALHEGPQSFERQYDGPRAAPLRIGADMSDAGGGGEPDWLTQDELRVAPLRARHDDMSGLQRRGQGGGAPGVRGRVLRCYFNAVTCF